MLFWKNIVKYRYLDLRATTIAQDNCSNLTTNLKNNQRPPAELGLQGVIGVPKFRL